jgi:hypothetical protein
VNENLGENKNLNLAQERLKGFEEKASGLKEKFLLLRKEFMKKEGVRGARAVLNVIESFAREIKEEFKNKTENYYLYHILISSTPNPNEITEYDFPEPFSIEKFINYAFEQEVNKEFEKIKNKNDI